MCVGLYLSHKMPVGTFEDVSVYVFFFNSINAKVFFKGYSYSDVHLLYLNIKTV